ncbi:hypothetical protein C1646_772288 [Rhizophagus diaphanus]|nr:hypothetical protein C1646_772288 [Rhizophagus diaphanus] [Rhizophagus sp. MUCL 43196]
MNLITIDEDEDTNKLGYDDPIDEEMSPLNELEQVEESYHYSLIGVAASNRFWSSFNELEVGREVQFCQRRFNASPEPMYLTSQPPSPNRRSLDSPALISVTVRSKTKVYKQKIAVANTTTFATLISFAIKVQPPTGKQFVIRAADGALEYMPDDLV